MLAKASTDVTMKKDLSKLDKKQNIIFDIGVILSIVLYAIAIAPKTLQNDTYYTIPIGKYISQHGIWNLTEDIFSWHELPYTYPHWLYDLMMYRIYNLGGHLGIYISTMVFTAILGMSIYLSSCRSSKNRVISFIITMFAMYMMKPYLAARAQIVTFILFSFTVYFIEMFLETHKKRYAIPLLIIPLLIANLHCAVFPFYFILYLPYIGEYLLITLVDLDLDYKIIKFILKIIIKLPVKKSLKDKLEIKISHIPSTVARKKDNREKRRKNPYKIQVKKESYAKWLILIAIIALLTGFLNPVGNNAYTYTWKTFKGNTTHSINEHLPLPLVDTKEFLIAICIFLEILIFTDTKIRLCDLFMLCGLIALAFTSRRQISMFVIFCTPILVRLISNFVEKYDINLNRKLFEFGGSVLGMIIIVLLFSIYTVNQLNEMKKNGTTYLDESTYPVQASDWILENLDINNLKIYNEYNFGSYLLFRGIPTFIDSRADLYAPEFNGDEKNGVKGRDIFTDALDIAGIAVDYNKKFKEYGVNHVISYSNSKLVMLLKNDSGYKQIYEDDHFTIFEVLSEENEKKVESE